VENSLCSKLFHFKVGLQDSMHVAETSWVLWQNWEVHVEHFEAEKKQTV